MLWLLSLPHELFSGRYWVKLVKFAVVHGHSRHRVETTLTRTVAVLARQVALALAFLKAKHTQNQEALGYEFASLTYSLYLKENLVPYSGK